MGNLHKRNVNFIRSIADVEIRDTGVKEDDLPLLSRDAMNVQRLLVNNPRDVAYEDALAIYQAACRATAPGQRHELATNEVTVR